VLVLNGHWMAWNTLLALVPLLVSFAVFRSRAVRPWRSPWWWVGVAAFVALLPNAPYVLTDVVHLQPQLAWAPSDGHRLLLAGEYGAFIAVGLGAYALSLWNLQAFLRRRGVGLPGVVAAMGILHALSTLGVYLGRVHRWNSWDLIRTPGAILDDIGQGLGQEHTVARLVAVFLMLAVGATAFVSAIQAGSTAVRARMHRG